MRARFSTSWLLLIAAALAVGIAFPHLELAWKCRLGFEASEACVWGRAYLPLTRWAEPVVISPLVFGAAAAARVLFSRARGSAPRSDKRA